MYLLILFIIQTFIESIDNYIITKEQEVIIPKIPDNKDSPLPYRFFVRIDICKYDINNSYVVENINNTIYFYNSFSKNYYSEGKIMVGGSDLKLIQSGISVFPYHFLNLDSSDNNQIMISKKSLTHFKVIYKTDSSSSFSTFFLYIINNYNTDFINICDLLENNNVLLMKEEYGGQLKEIIFEFDYKSKYKSETYKIAIIEKTIEDVYYKRGSATFKTSPYNLIILLIIFGIIFLILIFIAVIFIYKKIKNRKKNGSNNYKSYVKNEKNDFNSDYMKYSENYNNGNSPAPTIEDYNYTPENVVN